MVLLELDPNVVKPGWIPLIITILLAGAIAFLYLSMRKQMRKIDAPYAADLRAERRADAAGRREAEPVNDDTHDPETSSDRGPGVADSPPSRAGR